MALHVPIRFVLGFFFALCLHDVVAQHSYFVIRENSPQYSIHQYDLYTDDLYGINKTVHLFNLFPNPPRIRGDIPATFEQDLILFSVLPSLASDSNWIESDWELIKRDTLSYHDLIRLKMKALFQRFDICYDEKTKYLNDYRLVIQRDGKYFIAKNTLLQFFAIRERPTLFNALFGTINTKQSPYTIKDMATYYKQYQTQFGFPLDTYSSNYSIFDRIRDRKEFLSKSIQIGNHTAYQFWTFTDWHTKPYEYEVERGIDRFVYVPDKGIVGGSFDFYFYFHRKEISLDSTRFRDNIYNEKVMIAKDIE